MTPAPRRTRAPSSSLTGRRRASQPAGASCGRAALAIGLFGGPGDPGLAIGVPGEDRSASDAGAINVIYGGTSGLTGARHQLWDAGLLHLDSPEPGDSFGAALAAGS